MSTRTLHWHLSVNTVKRFRKMPMICTDVAKWNLKGLKTYENPAFKCFIALIWVFAVPCIIFLKWSNLSHACIYLNNIPACTIFIDLVSYSEQQQGSWVPKVVQSGAWGPQYSEKALRNCHHWRNSLGTGAPHSKHSGTCLEWACTSGRCCRLDTKTLQRWVIMCIFEISWSLPITKSWERRE